MKIWRLISNRSRNSLLLALSVLSVLSLPAHSFADQEAKSEGSSAFAEAAPPTQDNKASAKKVVPPPPIDEKAGSFTHAVDAVVLMGFGADDIPIPPELKGKLVAQSDLMKVELDFINKILADKSVSDSDKEMYEARYTLGDPRFDATVIQAHKQGILKLMLSDSNPIMEGKLGADKKVAVLDQSQVQLKSKDTGAGAIQRMLDSGMKLGRDIVLQPFYNAEKVQRVPIMHLKITLLRIGNKKYSIISSMNAAPHQRINRLMIYQEPQMFDDAKAHLETLAEGFRQGKGSNEMDPMPWTRYIYPGADAGNKALQESLTMRWTDGKYNPNLAIVDAMNNGSVLNYAQSEFAPTSKPVITTEGTDMAKDDNVRGLSISDDKFSDNFGWGMPALLNNITVHSEFQTSHGFGEKVASHVRAFIYQREAVDGTGALVAQTEEDGIPNNVVLDHEKTFICTSAVSQQDGIYTDLKGQKFKVTYKDHNDTTGTMIMVDDSGNPLKTAAVPLLKNSAFMGSFNLSGNVANTEIQIEHTETSASWINHAVQYTLEKLIETQPDYVVPFLEGILRSDFSKAFKIGVNFIPRKWVQAFMQAQQKGDVKGMTDAMASVAALKSTITKSLSDAEKQKIVQKFSEFMNWYVTLPPLATKPLELKRLLGLFLILGESNPKSSLVASVLNEAVWRPGMAPDKVSELIQTANQKLGLPELKLSNPTAKVAASDSAAGKDSSAGKTGTKKADATAQTAVAPTAQQRATDKTTTHATKKTISKPATDTAPEVAPKVVAKATPLITGKGNSVVVPVSGGSDALFVYDFDDTIVTLKSVKIRVYKIGSKDKDDFLEVSSSAWTRVRTQLGKTGKYKNYEVRKGTKTAPLSFMYYEKSATPNRNYLAQAIRAGITEAPEFVPFMQKLADSSLVSKTYILTAREHSSQEWIVGLKLLAAHAKVKHNIVVPNANIEAFVKNIIGVGYSTEGVALAKEEEIAKLRDQYKKDPSIQTIRFYDDDPNNVTDVGQIPNPSGAKPFVESILVTGKKSAATGSAALMCSEVFLQHAG